ncbi:hypothetical protein [Flavobacterium davisii]|uniref:hypothetical protein n=1 Tax=Flavobacterium davisii TaxID=2906077 RepID=UPI0035D0BF60
MVNKILLLFISLTTFAQTIQIENDRVAIDGVPVLQLKVISNRFKYDLYDLNNNLMLHAKMIPCRNCKESNEIQFELTNPNYSNAKKCSVLEESFSRSKEFIKMLCQYHVLSQKGLDLERLFTIDEERLKLESFEMKPVEENTNNKKIQIIENNLFVNGEKVGFFEEKIGSLDFKNGLLNYTKYILFDLDANFITSYCTTKNDNFFDHPDYFRLVEALQFNRLIVRDGTVYIYDTLQKEDALNLLVTKAFQHNYALGHFIYEQNMVDPSKSEQKKEMRYVNKSAEYFLCKHKEMVGIGTFDKIPGFNDQSDFKIGKQHLYFKPLDINVKPYIIHGKNGEKVFIETHNEHNSYLAFDLVNADFFDVYQAVEDAKDWLTVWYDFRKIVYENQNFYIASEYNQLLIKDKRKNKGIRLSDKKDKATEQILNYLNINSEVLKKANPLILSELIQIVSVAK